METIRVFDSQSEDYKRAFQIFLKHTDQKRNAKQWLQRLVTSLPARNVFIDAGAGNGELTGFIAEAFDHTIAIEPNTYLSDQLKLILPRDTMIHSSILAAAPAVPGDLVLCSHVLYYIPAEQWLEHIERLTSWMSPEGVTVLVLQNHATGCMAMLEHFFGLRFNLAGLVDAFLAKHGHRYKIVTTCDPAYVDLPDPLSAFAVAEFLLNLLPISRPPARREVEAYLAEHFLTPEGGYRFPVHQDFVQIQARP